MRPYPTKLITCQLKGSALLKHIVKEHRDLLTSLPPVPVVTTLLERYDAVLDDEARMAGRRTSAFTQVASMDIPVPVARYVWVGHYMWLVI